MRTLENGDTPILSGIQIYHDYVRPHDALNGITPAEAAGTSIPGESKWLTIVQNAEMEEQKGEQVPTPLHCPMCRTNGGNHCRGLDDKEKRQVFECQCAVRKLPQPRK